MNLATGRIISIICVAGGWIITGVRTVLDLIGYATLPEDAQVASGLVRDTFIYLLTVPWWAVWGFATLATIVLIVVSWPRHHVASNPSLTTPKDAEYKIDPWADAGAKTYVKVLIDKGNWRAEALVRENVYEVKVSFIGEGHKNIELVTIFDRWLLAQGLVIKCDRKLEGYRTEQVTESERYSICRLYNVDLPCVVELDFSR